MIFINNSPRFYVGIDPHKFIHVACVIDNDTNKLLTFTFDNLPSAFSDALSKILKITKCKDVIFGLEDITTSGFLFSYFLNDAGFAVKHVDASLASIYRSALPTYHKSDEYDAWCVAKVLRDSYKKLPDFRYEQIYSNIKVLVSLRNRISKQQSSDYILLHVQLSKVYPSYTKFFCNIQTVGALMFYKCYPSSRRLTGYTDAMLSKEMREYRNLNGYKGIFPESRSKKILDIVRANPVPFVSEIVEVIIVELIDNILDKEKRMDNIEAKLAPLIEESGYKLHTIPGVSYVTAAKIIADIGDINRFKNEAQLANFAGVAPITIGSGGKHKEYSSKGGNRALRATLYFLAITLISTHGDKSPRHKIFRDHYEKKVAQGKTKKQAVISVMRKMLRIIYKMMKAKSEWIEPTNSEVAIECEENKNKVVN